MIKVGIDSINHGQISTPRIFRPFPPLPRTCDRESSGSHTCQPYALFCVLPCCNPLAYSESQLRQDRLLIAAIPHVSGNCDPHLPQHFARQTFWNFTLFDTIHAKHSVIISTNDSICLCSIRCSLFRSHAAVSRLNHQETMKSRSVMPNPACQRTSVQREITRTKMVSIASQLLYAVT
jgi:hypothetical protein